MKIKTLKFLAVFITLLISLSLITVFFANLADKTNTDTLTRVACIGDSITELSNYPNDLQTMLGANYNVQNFGVSGTTVLINSGKPYIDQEAFQNAKGFLPNIVIILLGTNDARIDLYQSLNRFVADYKKLISQIQSLESKPKIFLVKPPPIYNKEHNLSDTNLQEGVIPRIEQVAKDLGLPTIDVYTSLANHPEYFMDGIHPDNEGAKIIANIIYKAITESSSS